MTKTNKYALILGSSSGFGRSTALELARQGYNIFGVHLDLGANKAKAEEVRLEIESLGVQVKFFNTNAADDNNRQEVLAEILAEKKNNPEMELRVLIHSLAFGALKSLVSKVEGNAVTRKQLEMTMDVMANSLIYWTQDLVSAGLLADNSRIFAFTSIGSYMAMQKYGAVSAAKAALESYIRQIAIELAPYQITANSIHAGLTNTPAASKIPGFKSMLKQEQIQNPLQRVTNAEDVAKVVGKLIDENFHWINGQVIKVDGGESVYKYFEWDDESEGGPKPFYG